MSDSCKIAEKEPIANELLKNFRFLAERAHNLAQRVDGKLQPIMRDPEPSCMDKTCSPGDCYPPLLDDYRNVMYQIQGSLATIEDCLNRTEV